MDIKQLKPLEKNPFKSKGDKQIKAIGKSISDFEKMMEIRKIVIDETNTILGGNKRYFALKMLGFKEVPDKWIDKREDLTEAQKREFIVKDNSHWGSEWDFDLLTEWDIDLNDYGVEFEIADDEEKEIEEVEPEDVETIKTEIQEGDLFQIGKHRLLCGDSTDSKMVKLLMNEEKADMVFTDPPYRMITEGGVNQMVGKLARKIGKAIKHLSDFNPIPYLDVLPQIFNKNYMNTYIFCNKDLIPIYLNWAIKQRYSFNILFWKKPSSIPLGGSHRPDVEYLLLFRKSAIWNNGLKDVTYSKCLEFGREKSTSHPTMKPLELIVNELKISSNKNSLVCDSFGGSGSTMIASEQLNRKCYMMELDASYCQVIINRIIKLNPELEIKCLNRSFNPLDINGF